MTDAIIGRSGRQREGGGVNHNKDCLTGVNYRAHMFTTISFDDQGLGTCTQENNLTRASA